MAGTLNWADVYGEPASSIQMASPISAAGPNQSFVAPAFSNPGTQSMGGPVGNAPTISLFALVIGLVVLRVAIELSDRT